MPHFIKYQTIASLNKLLKSECFFKKLAIAFSCSITPCIFCFLKNYLDCYLLLNSGMSLNIALILFFFVYYARIG